MLSISQRERVSSGLSYEEYSNVINSRLEKYNSDETLKSKYELLKLNQTRSSRIEKTYQSCTEAKEVLTSVNKPQVWMVITESWCGDSAQNIPYLKKLADENPLIIFKLLLRDDNPDIMDLYLTNGTRSVPMLIAYDEEWNEIFRWGSRPAAAIELMNNLKTEGVEKGEIMRQLHSWYAVNKGKALENEICEIIRREIVQEVL
jgi:hypothetical protein